MARRSRKTELHDILSAAAAGSAVGNINMILQAVRTHLGMDVAFVSEFVGDRRVFRHVDAVAGAPMQPGDSGLPDEGYCHRIVDGRLPQLMPDTAAVPEAMALPITSALPIGAHLSIPIRLSDGRVYGTFCCFSFSPDASLNERDLQIMRAFAELARSQIEKDIRASRKRVEQHQRIERVIAQQRFSSVYQPIYELGAPDRIVGLECLTRFSDVPYRSPDLWFAEAAEMKIAAALDLAAMRAALNNHSAIPADIYLAVNLSPQTILDRQFRRALRDLPLTRLVLEVTEHQAIDVYAQIAQVLEPYRRAGVRIAVDDAGAGYASMRHILHLRPDLVKLDMSLTRDIDSDPARRALVLALVGFAREVGCQLISEGVETAAELETLRLLGVRKAQGYALARPMPLNETVSLVSQMRQALGRAHEV